MTQSHDFSSWFQAHWTRVTLPVAVAVLLLLPVTFAAVSAATFFALLFVPLFLLHQYDEHAGDRLRYVVNRIMASSLEPLSPRRTLLIAALGGWLPLFAAPLLSAYASPVFVVIPAVLALLEVVLHLSGVLVMGKSSPGLPTALVLLLPFAVFAVGAAETAGAELLHYLGAFAVAAAPRAFGALLILGQRNRLAAAGG
jgi:hypothetical protein